MSLGPRRKNRSWGTGEMLRKVEKWERGLNQMLMKKKHRQSMKANLDARYDARVQGVIAPSHRMGVLSERDRV